MGIRIGIGNLAIGSGSGKSWSSYWATRNTLNYSTRSGNTLTETVGGLNARVLPAVYKGNSGGYYPYYTSALWASDDWVMYFDMEFTVLPNAENVALFSQAGSLILRIATDNKWYFTCNDGTNNRNITISAATLPIQTRKYSFKIVHAKNGSTTIYESGNQVGTASGTFTNLPSTGSNRYSYFGYNGGSGATLSNKCNLVTTAIYSDLAETTLIARYSFTGDANCYDISGNNRNIAGQSIVAANKAYSLNGSTYALDSGWTLWQHASTADIRVPYGCTTSPIASGYTITKVYVGDTDAINMADCVIGFNETSSADAKLEIFDRSNTDRQEDASRASAYYAATSLATKSRYHISEIFPHEVFTALFKTDYKNRVYSTIAKTGSDFNVTAVNAYSESAVTGGLAFLKNLFGLDNKYTVGTDKNFKVIQRAVNYVSTGGTVTVDAGSYNENVTLAGKVINLTGLGNREAIIKTVRATGDVDTLPVINVPNNSILTNLVLDLDYTRSAVNPILAVNNASPTLINCKIGQNGGEFKSEKPFTISGTSVVNMTNCDLDFTYGTIGLVEDSSVLNFEGSYIGRGVIKGTDTAKINIDVDTYRTGARPNGCLILEDTSEALVIINTKLETPSLADGIWYALCEIHDDAKLEIRGNNIYAGAVMEADCVNAEFLANGVTTDMGGAIWTAVTGCATTVKAEIRDCHLVHDVDNDFGGLHMYEDGSGYYNGITLEINDSYLEFTGFDGNWHTFGNPLYGFGNLKMRNTEVVDHINDTPLVGYHQTIAVGNIDFEDCIIRQVSYTASYCPIIAKTFAVGVTMQIRLKDCVLNNGARNAAAIFLVTGGRAIEATDYICIDNVTTDSTLGLYTDDSADPAGNFALLQSQCP